MDLGGLAVFVETVIAIAACATLLFSIVGAAYGARHGAPQGGTTKRKVSAILCGCLSGVAMAAIIVIAFNSVAGFVFCPLFGGGISYVVARAVVSGLPEHLPPRPGDPIA